MEKKGGIHFEELWENEGIDREETRAVGLPGARGQQGRCETAALQKQWKGVFLAWKDEA